MAKCSLQTCMETKGVVLYGSSALLYCREHWQVRWHAEQIEKGMRVLCRDCLPASQKQTNVDLADTNLCPACGNKKQLYYSPGMK
jgi:hypothetical protein